MGKNATDNLLGIAQKMADEKLGKERERVAEQIKNELDDVKKAVEMVRSGLCYKKVDEYGIKRYLFATEEMLLNDYLTEPENSYISRGLRFSEDAACHGYIFIVNGHYYYDMRYLLNQYEQDVTKEKNRITGYNDRLDELIREFNRLLEEHEAIKKMLEDWSKRQNCESEGRATE